MNATEVTTVTKKPAEVSKGDTVLHEGHPRVVDLVIDAGSVVFVEFEGIDLDEHGKPEFFFSVPFEPTDDLTVIPAA